MLVLHRVLPSCSQASLLSCRRNLHFTSANLWHEYDNNRFFDRGEDPYKKTKSISAFEFRRAKRRFLKALYDPYKRKNPIASAFKNKVLDYELWPAHSEIFIIGGGLTGSSIAYWLKQHHRDENLTVAVLEDPTKFATSRSMLSSGIITQQFSVPEFIETSLFSAEFLRHAGEHLQIEDNDLPDINLLPCGFMHLATNNEEAERLKTSWKLQIEKGARVAFWNKDELEQNFPFMNFDSIVAGTYGLENEGVIDNWQLLSALREKNISLGVTYMQGEIESFTLRRDQVESEMKDFHGQIDTEMADDMIHSYRRVIGVNVKPIMQGTSARFIECAKIVNAAGPWAGNVAEMCGIGKGPDLMSVPVPVKPRKRTFFLIHAPDVPDLIDLPSFYDPSGVFCRPHDMGYNFVCGRIPTKEEDLHINHEDLSVDFNEFYEKVWPALAHRVPLFKNAKVVNGWSLLNDVNTWDDAPILDMPLHWGLSNFFQMSGFGSYGPQMSLAVGKGFSERLYDDAYTSTNLRIFDMRRMLYGTRIYEPLKIF